MRDPRRTPQEWADAHNLRGVFRTEQDVMRCLQTRQGDHSIFAPSAAKMWLSCPGSLIPNLLQPDTTGPDAAYGTVAHSIMERWQQRNDSLDEEEGNTITVDGHAITVDAEMLEYCRDIMDKIVELQPLRSRFAKVWHEERVLFDHLTPIPDQGGTADRIAYDPVSNKRFGTSRLDVSDYKFGKGVHVDATDNPQLRLYALGALRLLAANPLETSRPSHVTMAIYQPRRGNYQVVEESAADLIAWGRDVVQPAAQAAWTLDAPRTPTPEGCRWCKVAHTCRERAAQHEAWLDGALDLVEGEPETLPSPRQHRDPRDLTTEELGQILLWQPLAEKWFSSIREELTRRARDGDVPSTHKLVQGRSRSAYRLPPEDIRWRLARIGIPASDLMRTEMVSPNQLKAVLKAHGIGGRLASGFIGLLTERTPGPDTLAPVTDRRPAKLSPPVDDMTEEDDDTDL